MNKDKGGAWNRVIVSSTLLPERLAEYERNREALESGRPLAVATPFGELNRALNGGFRPGKVYVLGGGSGVGKSALALRFARAACEAGHRALYITYEVSPEYCLDRVVSDVAGIQCQDLQNGRAKPSDIEDHLAELKRQTEDLVFLDGCLMDDGETLGPGMIEAALVTLQAQTHTPLVIIDYLQMAAVASMTNEREVRVRVSRYLEQMFGVARRRRVPVLLLSSINRAAYDGKPTLAAFKESGDIEFGTDVAMILDRAPEGEGRQPQNAKPLNLHVLKNRDGANDAVIPLDFEGRFMRFSEAQR